MARIKPQRWHHKGPPTRQIKRLPRPNRLAGQLRPRTPRSRRGMPGLPSIRHSSQPPASLAATGETGKGQKASVDLFSTIDAWRTGRRLGWREWSVLAFMGVWAFWVLFMSGRDVSLMNKLGACFLFLLVLVIGYVFSAVARK